MTFELTNANLTVFLLMYEIWSVEYCNCLHSNMIRENKQRQTFVLILTACRAANLEITQTV